MTADYTSILLINTKIMVRCMFIEVNDIEYDLAPSFS